MPSESVVACDDGHVRKLGTGCTIVSCILWDLEEGPITSSSRPVRVDGLDASSVIAGIIQELGPTGYRLKALLLDSITIAGFNVVSPSTIEKLAGLPTIIIYKYKPSLGRLLAPLRENFSDWELRARVIAVVDTAHEVETGRGKLYVISWGLGIGRARALIERLQFYSRVPEPLRMAHYLASSLSRLFERELWQACE